MSGFAGNLLDAGFSLTVVLGVALVAWLSDFAVRSS